MSTPFAPPSPPGSGIDFKELNGALLLIEVISIETGIQTSFGSNDAVRADVHVLDGPKAGERFLDTLIFPKVLQGQLKRSVGQKVLGRLGQGQAKPGQSPPWLLAEATPQDQQVGVQYLNSQLAQPQQPQQTPAPQQQQQGWGQQGQQGGNVPF